MDQKSSLSVLLAAKRCVDRKDVNHRVHITRVTMEQTQTKRCADYSCVLTLRWGSAYVGVIAKSAHTIECHYFWLIWAQNKNEKMRVNWIEWHYTIQAMCRYDAFGVLIPQRMCCFWSFICRNLKRSTRESWRRRKKCHIKHNSNMRGVLCAATSHRTSKR